MFLHHGPDENTTPAPDDYLDLSELVDRATDPTWYEATGMCGGCGNATCHDGPCPGNRNGYCTTCPTRRETGEVR